MNQQHAPHVTDEQLSDLRERLTRTRLVPSRAKTVGVGHERIQQLVTRWAELDWRSVEAWLDEFGSASTTTSDGRRLHYLHRTPESETDRLPMLLLHGWPDSPLQFRRLAPALLTAGHPIVAPSAPGFGFSDEPEGELSPELVAADIAALMSSLGYERYVVHGTDWGATVGAALAEAAPHCVAGLHLLQPPFDRAFQVDRATASEAETAYLTKMDTWGESAAYVSAHTHSADTLAAGFSDSPVGLLAWIAERYDAWTGGGVDDDDLIAAAALMWLTGTFRSSVRLYSEPAAAWDWAGEDGGDGDGSGGSGQEWGTGEGGADTSTAEDVGGTAGWDASEGAGEEWGGDWGSRIETPTAFAICPQDIGMPPRDFCERFFAVTRFTVMPRGGHWAALEEADLIAEDLAAFAGTL